MIYVMSDIHGCYDKYMMMLDKIRFSSEDELYILGDVVDRGANGIKILLDIARRKNVVLLKGNHDQQAAIMLENLDMLFKEPPIEDFVNLYKVWLLDGGNTTLNEFLESNLDEQEIAIDVIRNALLIKEIHLNGESYILAHSVPGIEEKNQYPDWSEMEILLGEPDYEKQYYDDKYIVTGHTPTGLIEKSSVGRIWKNNRHIAIDCGAVFGKKLGCLCLDTMEEYYI